MKAKTVVVLVLALLLSCGVCHGKDDRWLNFAEDGDLKYYLDQKTVVALADNVYSFWVKSVAKQKDYFKREYNLSSLSYLMTNYELDCGSSSYRVRGTIMFDRNRREINKSVNDYASTPLEPVPPESVLELVQEEICEKEEGADLPEDEDLPVIPYVVPLAPAPAELAAEEPPTLQ